MDKRIIGFAPPTKTVTYPAVSSKSYTHRYIISAAMAEGITLIKNASICDDTLATVNALRAFGVHIDVDYLNRTMRVDSRDGLSLPKSPVFCSESGSTLRFMIPQALRFDKWVWYDSGPLLSKRPLNSYKDFFDRVGVLYNSKKAPSFGVKGLLSSGVYSIASDVSSQFASGLAMFLSSKNSSSTIKLTGKIESLDYIKMTVDSLREFGVDIKLNGFKIEIAEGDCPKSGEYIVEGDYSQAAFFIAMGALGSGIKISGLKMNSSQADRRMMMAIEDMGIDFEEEGGVFTIYPSRPKPCIIDVSECPDIAAPIALLMSLADGNSIIKGASRLRYKETDRLETIAQGLSSIGADIRVLKDGLSIRGVSRLRGGVGDSQGDHRIAMMLASAAPASKGEILIKNAECVKKSYPGFFEDFKSVGGISDD